MRSPNPRAVSKIAALPRGPARRPKSFVGQTVRHPANLGLVGHPPAIRVSMAAIRNARALATNHSSRDLIRASVIAVRKARRSVTPIPDATAPGRRVKALRRPRPNSAAPSLCRGPKGARDGGSARWAVHS